MNRLSAFIARVGEDPKFIAFNAHCWFAYAVVITFSAFGANVWKVAAVAYALAALKEFLFDATQEHNPPQRFVDNVEDFVGYSTGIALAVAVHFL